MQIFKTIKIETDKHNMRLFFRWRIFTIQFAIDGKKYTFDRFGLKVDSDLYTR